MSNIDIYGQTNQSGNNVDPFLGQQKESDLSVDDMSHEMRSRLSAKVITQQWNYQNFWRSYMDRGKRYFDYAVGDVLNAEEKAQLKTDDKMIIQIPELITKINAMVGMQINATKKGAIVSKGGNNAPEAEVMDEMIKSIDRENRASYEFSQAFMDGLISSYPQFMFFDESSDPSGTKTLEMYKENWDACLPDPNFTRPDQSDMDDFVRLRTMTKQKMLEKWPNRSREIEIGVREGNANAEFWNSTLYTAEERDILFNSLTASSEMFNRNGTTYVFERYFFQKEEKTVYVSPYSEEPEVLPPEWDKARKERWQALHPDYKEMVLEWPVLYVTITTSSGILLENAPHWYQENEFPFQMFIPMMLNNKPRGLVEFMADNLKLSVIADIEHIHSVRLSNNNLMITKKGAIVNAEEAASEKARPGGHIVVDDDVEIGDAVAFPANNREQRGFADLKAQTLATNDRISVDRNFEGGSQSSQESGKVVQQRISQTMNKNTPYMNNFNLFFLACQRKKLKMIPYIYTEEQVLRYQDEATRIIKEIQLNTPTEYDWLTGAVTNVMNNLAGAKYDYIEVMGDDSISGKEAELQAFADTLRNILPAMDIQFWPMLLTSMPNRMANELGLKLQEQLDAQAQAGPDPEPIKLSFAIKGEDVLYNPTIIDILKKEGVLPPEYQVQNVRPPADVDVNLQKQSEMTNANI